jgi:adenylate cyclase
MMEDREVPRHSPVQDAIAWILTQATDRDDLGELLAGTCERLAAAGVPIWRASFDLPTIDPLSRALMHKWWRDAPVDVETLPHGPDQQAVFQRSVIFHMMSQGEDFRRWRLEDGEGVGEFSLLQTLKQSGATDYAMRLVKFGGRTTAAMGVAFSVATDRPGGFAEAELALVLSLVPALGLAAYRVSADRTGRNALSVYLGPKTAERVLAGEIRRGEGERMAAAILFADLKGFTAVAEQEDPLRVVGWLNEHFEAIGTAVTARGGEILKFMGDGILAVFPVDDPDERPCAGCAAALAAAEEARAANGRVNAERLRRGEPVLDVHVALHFGEVVYGNVGASRRLDFTVIGPAVNETCRMEALCDELGCPVLLSEAFSDRCASPTRAVGHFVLRGMAGARMLHAPA